MTHRATSEIPRKLVAVQPTVWMLRIGYAARGVLFLLIGGFALLAAGGFGVHPQGARDALEYLFAARSAPWRCGCSRLGC